MQVVYHLPFRHLPPHILYHLPPLFCIFCHPIFVSSAAPFLYHLPHHFEKLKYAYIVVAYVVADMEVDMVADMEVDKVIDIVWTARNNAGGGRGGRQWGFKVS